VGVRCRLSPCAERVLQYCLLLWDFMAETSISSLLAQLDSECGDHHCGALKAELEKCTMRVESKEGTAETCEQEFKDFMHCVDHCVCVVWQCLDLLTSRVSVIRTLC
jgi:hypothetical protein